MLTRATDVRITETPNAVMTTLASPTQGGTTGLSLWQVTMTAGQRGPRHSFDTEQAWYVVSGTATITTDAAHHLTTGDTLVIPADAPRQVATDAGVTFVVTGRAGALATPTTPDGPGDPVAPAWIV